jgi:hypothetical protein
MGLHYDGVDNGIAGGAVATTMGPSPSAARIAKGEMGPAMFLINDY